MTEEVLDTQLGWRAKALAKFELNVPVQIGVAQAVREAGSFGLSVPIQIGMSSTGKSSAAFGLDVPVRLSYETAFVAAEVGFGLALNLKVGGGVAIPVVPEDFVLRLNEPRSDDPTVYSDTFNNRYGTTDLGPNFVTRQGKMGTKMVTGPYYPAYGFAIFLQQVGQSVTNVPGHNSATWIEPLDTDSQLVQGRVVYPDSAAAVHLWIASGPAMQVLVIVRSDLLDIRTSHEWGGIETLLTRGGCTLPAGGIKHLDLISIERQPGSTVFVVKVNNAVQGSWDGVGVVPKDYHHRFVGLGGHTSTAAGWVDWSAMDLEAHVVTPIQLTFKAYGPRHPASFELQPISLGVSFAARQRKMAAFQFKIFSVGPGLSGRPITMRPRIIPGPVSAEYPDVGTFNWQAPTWFRWGTDYVDQVLLGAGGGGAGAGVMNSAGAQGGQTSVSGGGLTTLLAAGGTGGPTSGSSPTGKGVAPHTFNGVGYPGSGAVAQGSAGSVPGGGGGGSSGSSGISGGNGGNWNSRTVQPTSAFSITVQNGGGGGGGLGGSGQAGGRGRVWTRAWYNTSVL